MGGVTVARWALSASAQKSTSEAIWESLYCSLSHSFSAVFPGGLGLMPWAKHARESDKQPCLGHGSSCRSSAAMPSFLPRSWRSEGNFCYRTLAQSSFVFCFWLLSVFHRDTTGHKHVRKRIFKNWLSKRYFKMHIALKIDAIPSVCGL